MNVGQRTGKPIVLTVHSGEMAQTGMSFFLSDNGVWLTDTAPSKYLDFPNVI